MSVLLSIDDDTDQSDRGEREIEKGYGFFPNLPEPSGDEHHSKPGTTEQMTLAPVSGKQQRSRRDDSHVVKEIRFEEEDNKKLHKSKLAEAKVTCMNPLFHKNTTHNTTDLTTTATMA